MIEKEKYSSGHEKRLNPPVKRRSRAIRVWHVTDWQALYELSDDIRKRRSGPLRYVKTLATLSPFCLDAEARYFERLCRLKASPQRHLFRSMFEEFKVWCATKPFGLRGYFVTAGNKPATYKYLAEQLGMSVVDIKQSVPALGRLGFLERLSMNGEAAISSRKTGSVRKPKNALKKTKRKSRRKAQNGAKHALECPTNGLPDSAGLSRNEPESSCRPSRKAKVKSKSKGKTNDKAKATSRQTAAGCKRKKNGDDKAESQAQAQGQAQSRTATSAATAPSLPSQPQRSDEGGQAIPFTCPPDSAEISRHGLAYGRNVYLKLGYCWDIDSPKAYREISSFGSKHDQVHARLSGLPAPEVDAILSRGLREAVKIAKRPANKNRAAVWHTLMNKLLTAAKQRGPP